MLIMLSDAQGSVAEKRPGPSAMQVYNNQNCFLDFASEPIMNIRPKQSPVKRSVFFHRCLVLKNKVVYLYQAVQPAP